MKDRLEKLLRHVSAFDDADLEKILPCFKPKSVRKHTLLLQTGEVCKAFYYVHTGCLRTGFLDRNAEEKTRLVMTDSTIGTALTSFISQQPSFEFISAVEDSELLYISYADFYQLNKACLNWTYFYQRMLEMAYSYQNRRIEQFVTLTAKKRYEMVMRENPLLLQKLSNKELASYLGIREETLSRLKSG